jgi:hypothetical protein
MSLLRSKASYYEHELPVEKRLYPTCDDICNEMEAFINGFESGHNSKGEV